MTRKRPFVALEDKNRHGISFRISERAQERETGEGSMRLSSDEREAYWESIHPQKLHDQTRLEVDAVAGGDFAGYGAADDLCSWATDNGQHPALPDMPSLGMEEPAPEKVERCLYDRVVVFNDAASWARKDRFYRQRDELLDSEEPEL